MLTFVFGASLYAMRVCAPYLIPLSGITDLQRRYPRSMVPGTLRYLGFKPSIVSLHSVARRIGSYGSTRKGVHPCSWRIADEKCQSLLHFVADMRPVQRRFFTDRSDHYMQRV